MECNTGWSSDYAWHTSKRHQRFIGGMHLFNCVMTGPLCEPQYAFYGLNGMRLPPKGQKWQPNSLFEFVVEQNSMEPKTSHGVPSRSALWVLRLLCYKFVAFWSSYSL